MSFPYFSYSFFLVIDLILLFFPSSRSSVRSYRRARVVEGEFRFLHLFIFFVSFFNFPFFPLLGLRFGRTDGSRAVEGDFSFIHLFFLIPNYFLILFYRFSDQNDYKFKFLFFFIYCIYCYLFYLFYLCTNIFRNKK